MNRLEELPPKLSLIEYATYIRKKWDRKWFTWWTPPWLFKK